jgi:Ca-activated chloride channel family protein
MRCSNAGWISALALAVASAAPAAQTFKSGTDVISVPITVTNRSSSERIRDLRAEDFRVFDNGKEQPVSVFLAERLPLSICIVVDASGSMAGERKGLAATAIDRVFAGLEPGDEVSLLIFSKEVEVRLPWTPAGAIPPIDWAGWELATSTALLDGVRAGLQQLESARNSRAVMLLVTDGFENTSRISPSRLARTRRQSEALIYGFEMRGAPSAPSIGAMGREVPPADKRVGIHERGRLDMGSAPAAPSTVLMDLAKDSGGYAFPIQDNTQALAQPEALLNELRYQYTLGYAMPKADGSFRRIKVEARRGGMKVRHRGTYLALPATSRQ